MVSSQEDINKVITENQDQLKSLGAKSLGLFGSFARNEANADSDVDMIVEFRDGQKTYDNFIELAELLENLLGRRVELVTESSLSKYIKPHIQKEVIYVPIDL